MAMLEDEEALIICNGYKDEEYVETALLASKLGRTVILVVEKLSELTLIAEIAKRIGVKPRIGMRAKLSTRGVGRWEASGGDRSKFGLTSREMIEAVEFLKQNDLLDSLRAPALPPRLADLAHPHAQERDARGGALLRRAAQDGRAAASTSTSAAASASTTTARRRTSSRR